MNPTGLNTFVIEQHQRVGAPPQPVSGRTVAGQLDQVTAGFAVKEPGADHAETRLAPELVGKRFLRIPGESGYNKQLNVCTGVPYGFELVSPP